jgi:hypothetical protein
MQPRRLLSLLHATRFRVGGKSWNALTTTVRRGPEIRAVNTGGRAGEVREKERLVNSYPPDANG